MRSGLQQARLTEPRAVRLAVTAVALTFVALFLVVPLAAVFAQAFAKGFKAYRSAIVEPTKPAPPVMRMCAPPSSLMRWPRFRVRSG